MVHDLAAAVIVREGRILLGKRAPERALWPGLWDVFGGHIEPGESPAQALVRELQEEVGITPRQWTELEVIRDSLPESAQAPRLDLVVHFYCVTAWTGTPFNRQPEEHSTIQWFTLEEASRLHLAYAGYPEIFARCL